MTPLPHRIQRRRTKGWRMPAGALYVGRPGAWGNPYRLHRKRHHIDRGMVTPQSHAEACVLFREYLLWWLQQEPKIMRAALDDLRGKDLACFCSPCQPCHADTLLILANAPREPQP